MTPAGLPDPFDSAGAGEASPSYQDNAYLPSSRACASWVSRSGLKVSHITASSSVSVVPIDFSASPGCGPVRQAGRVERDRADVHALA